MLGWCAIIDWKEDGSPVTRHSASCDPDLRGSLEGKKNLLLVTKFDNTQPRVVSQSVRRANGIDCLLVAYDLAVVHFLDGISGNARSPFDSVLVALASSDDPKYLVLKERAACEISWQDVEAEVARAISETRDEVLMEELYAWKYDYCAEASMNWLDHAISHATGYKVEFEHESSDRNVLLGIVPDPTEEHGCSRPGYSAIGIRDYLFKNDRVEFFPDVPGKHHDLEAIRRAWYDVAHGTCLADLMRGWKRDTICLDDIVDLLCWNGAADVVAAGVPIEDVLA